MLKEFLQKFVKKKEPVQVKDELTLPSVLLDAIKVVGGDKTDVVFSSSEAFPISSSIKKTEEDRRNNPSPGDLIEGEGIYVGQWSFTSEGRQPLEMTFRVYAAPEDLRDRAGNKNVFSYGGAIERLNNLKDWHNHAGKGYLSEEQLRQALKKGRYDGEWVIPPWGILAGQDGMDGQKQKNNIYVHRNTKEFQGSFLEAARVKNSAYSGWYWSCAESSNAAVLSARAIDMESGEVSRLIGDIALSCRPVRLVPINTPVKIKA